MFKKLIKPAAIIPLFIPRFLLVEAELVGFDVQMKPSTHQTLIGDLFYRTVVSGTADDMLQSIGAQLKHWNNKLNKALFVSVEVSIRVNPDELCSFLQTITNYVPAENIEIMLNPTGIGGHSHALYTAVNPLLKTIALAGCRKGLLHNGPFTIPLGEFDSPLDTVKLKKAAIAEIQDDINATSQLAELIELLNRRAIALVVEGLYTKQDVTSAILMGAGYGQGYFLTKSRFETFKTTSLKVRKKLSKSVNDDFNIDSLLFRGAL